jgi:hypothetical protein
MRIFGFDNRLSYFLLKSQKHRNALLEAIITPEIIQLERSTKKILTYIWPILYDEKCRHILTLLHEGCTMKKFLLLTVVTIGLGAQLLACPCNAARAKVATPTVAKK